jgi:hypothetical protein
MVHASGYANRVMRGRVGVFVAMLGLSGGAVAIVGATPPPSPPLPASDFVAYRLSSDANHHVRHGGQLTISKTGSVTFAKLGGEAPQRMLQLSPSAVAHLRRRLRRALPMSGDRMARSRDGGDHELSVVRAHRTVGLTVYTKSLWNRLRAVYGAPTTLPRLATSRQLGLLRYLKKLIRRLSA